MTEELTMTADIFLLFFLELSPLKIHVHLDAEPADFALFSEQARRNLSKQKGFHALCEHYRQLDESTIDSFCVFNPNSQKPNPLNFNVELEDSTLLDTIQTKYNLLSRREAFHVLCNAFRGISETPICENTQIEPSVEIIRPTHKPAKLTSALSLELEKAAVRDELGILH